MKPVETLSGPELRQRLAGAFRWVDPGADSDHLVSDLAGIWRDPALLRSIGPALAALYADEAPTVVVSPEVTGFLVGPLVATALGVGFVPAIKNGGDRKPADTVAWSAAPPDYRGRRLWLGVRERHLGPGDRMLVVDDWVATGAQVTALYDLAAARGATAVGCATLVAACSRPVAETLRLRYVLHADNLEP